MHIVERSVRYPPCSPMCFDTAGLVRRRGVDEGATVWRGHKLGGNLRQTNYRCKPDASTSRTTSIIRVRLQATRRGIRDLSTPAVDSELVNARVPLTPRKTPSSIRRRCDKEVGHHWRGNVCVSGSNRDTGLSMERCDTFSTMIRASEVSLQFWRSSYSENDQLRRKELFCEHSYPH